MGWSWGDGPPPTATEKLIAENALAQFDRVIELVQATVDRRERFRFTPDLVRELNRLAVQGLEATAGEYRREDVVIWGSKHVPPHWQDVPRLVEEMCSYVSARAAFEVDEDVAEDVDADTKVAIHLAAYVMWRLNWIHPFANGNGRTARAASYLVLSIQLRMEIPGTTTIPDRIDRNRFPYNDALEAADEADKLGRLDVTEMEKLLIQLTLDQLKDNP